MKKRFTKEQYIEIWKAGNSKTKGETWDMVGDKLNKLFGCDYTSSCYRKAYEYYCLMANAIKDCIGDTKDVTSEFEVQRRNLEKERMKLQTEKLEYRRWLREDAREEMVLEKITDAISSLSPIEVPNPVPNVPNKRGAVLCLADQHFNTEFEIKGLFGEVLNSYSPEIFYERMWKLRDKVKEICERENLTHLYIFGLGDDNDGILRLQSNLFKLRYGMMDSTIVYAEFMSQWLNEISKFVTVELQMVMDSNHNQLRLCGAPKNAFQGENLAKIIIHIIETRLENNNNIKIIKNETGYIYSNICGYNIIGIHGETKSLKTAIDNLTRLYGIRLDYIVGGHKHHSEEYGFDCEGISVGSIIGIDDYSTSLMRASNASSTMLIFEENNGLVTKHTIKLN